MFTAYFDAAGDANQPFVIVSGYIANYIQWTFLENAWADLHTKFGAALPFHATEFMAAINNFEKYRKQSNARADYVALASNPEQAKRFLINLSQLGASIPSCAVTAVIPMETYEGVSSLLDLRKVIPPYAFGARLCIEIVRKWERFFDVADPVECIFEAGDFEQGKFTKLMIDEGASCPIYKDKKDFAGLQAADHYAWERVSMRKQMERGNSTPTIVWQFLGAIPVAHLETTTTNLINVCHLKGIDPRTGIQHGDRI